MPPYYERLDEDDDEDDEEGHDDDDDLEEEDPFEEESEESEESGESEIEEVGLSSQADQGGPIDRELSRLLEVKASIGSAVINSSLEVPNPRIYLKDYGWLREPPILQTQRLDKSPFDKLGSVGYTVLDDSQFGLYNLEWRPFVSVELHKSLGELRIETTYALGNARLLLCNSPGLVVVPQQATRTADHFGTLMVLFPSDTGTRSVRTSGYSEAKFWSADPQFHSGALSCFWLYGLQVTIGEGQDLCAALLYEVTWKGTFTDKPTAQRGLDRLENIKTRLADWRSQDTNIGNECPTFIYYPLSQWHYSPDVESVLRVEKEAMATLKVACNATNFTLWFLAYRITKEYQMGYYRSHYGMQGEPQSKPEEPSIEASISWLTKSSMAMINPFAFDNPDLFNKGLLKYARSKRERDYRSRSLQHTNSASGLILLPSEFAEAFLMRYVFTDDEQQGTLELAFEAWQSDPDGVKLSKWNQMCKLVIDSVKPSSRGNSPSILKVILTESVSVPDPVGEEIFFKAFDKWNPFAAVIGPDYQRVLAHAIVRFGWAKVLPKMDQIFVYEGSLAQFQRIIEAFRDNIQEPLQEAYDAHGNENVNPIHPLDSIKMWAHFRLLLLLEKLDITIASNFHDLKSVLKKLPKHLIPQFLEVIGKSVATHRTNVFQAYSMFEYFASRVVDTPEFAAVAEAAFQSFSDTLQISTELTAESVCRFVEDIGSRSMVHLDLLVQEILSLSNMHMKRGIASRWIAFLPALADVAMRHTSMFVQISSLMIMILVIYLVLDTGPPPRPDVSFPARTLNCPCQYCAIINHFLADRNNSDFFGAGLCWTYDACKHVNDFRRNFPLIQSKTNFRFLQQSTQPYLRITKIDRDFAGIDRAWEQRRKYLSSTLQLVLTATSHQYTPGYLLGDLAMPLQNQDEPLCRRFLQAAVNTSLTQTVFELSLDIDFEYRQRIVSVIKARGGEIVTELPIQDAAISTTGRKRVIVTKSEQDADNTKQAHLKYYSPYAITKISVMNFQKFVDYLWSDSLIERFHPASIQPTARVKRKASQLERHPLTDESNYAVSVDTQTRAKLPRLESTNWPADRDDKENLLKEEPLEVVDLT